MLAHSSPCHAFSLLRWLGNWPITRVHFLCGSTNTFFLSLSLSYCQSEKQRNEAKNRMNRKAVQERHIPSLFLTLSVSLHKVTSSRPVLPLSLPLSPPEKDLLEVRRRRGGRRLEIALAAGRRQKEFAAFARHRIGNRTIARLGSAAPTRTITRHCRQRTLSSRIIRRHRMPASPVIQYSKSIEIQCERAANKHYWHTTFFWHDMRKRHCKSAQTTR